MGKNDESEKEGASPRKRGRGHVWTREEAKANAKKGGDKVSQDREHMRDIARRGGQAKARLRNIDCGDVPEPKPRMVNTPPADPEEEL